MEEIKVLDENTNIVEVDLKVETNTTNFIVRYAKDEVVVAPYELHQKEFKYLSEFTNFFVNSVGAPKDSATLFTSKASKAVDTICEFNRLAI